MDSSLERAPRLHRGQRHERATSSVRWIVFAHRVGIVRPIDGRPKRTDAVIRLVARVARAEELASNCRCCGIADDINENQPQLLRQNSALS